MSIWAEEGIGRVAKWCDDFVMLRYPTRGNGTLKDPYEYSYDRAKALRKIESLGVPWHPQKGQEFGNTFTYVGLDWDINAKTVSLPDGKRLKYLAMVEKLMNQRQCNLQTIQGVIGCLSSCTVIVPMCRSYLQFMDDFCKSFGSSKKTKVLLMPGDVIFDLEWWATTLRNPVWLKRELHPDPRVSLVLHVYVNPDKGIGITYDENSPKNEWSRWSAWRLQRPARGLFEWMTSDDKNWRLLQEAIAIEIAVYLVLYSGNGLHNMAIKICCTAYGRFAKVWEKGRHPNREVNMSIRRTVETLEEKGVRLVLECTDDGATSSRGKLARKLAQGVEGPAEKRESIAVDLPPEIAPFVKEVMSEPTMSTWD